MAEQDAKNLEAENSARYIENQKIVLDYLKHVTILSTGAIVLIPSLLDKAFINANWKPLLSASVGCFVLSVVSLTLSALGIVRSVRTPLDISRGLVMFTGLSFLIGLVPFVIGISGVATFVAYNLLK